MKQYGIILEVPEMVFNHIYKKYNLNEKNTVSLIIENYSNIKIDLSKDTYRIDVQRHFETDFVWIKIVAEYPIVGLVETPIGAYFPHRQIYTGELL